MSKTTKNWLVGFYLIHGGILAVAALMTLSAFGCKSKFEMFSEVCGSFGVFQIFFFLSAVTYYTAYKDRSVKYLSFLLFILLPIILLNALRLQVTQGNAGAVVIIIVYWWISCFLLRRENKQKRLKESTSC